MLRDLPPEFFSLTAENRADALREAETMPPARRMNIAPRTYVCCFPLNAMDLDETRSRHEDINS